MKHIAALLCLFLLGAPPAPALAGSAPTPTEDLRVAVDEVIRILGDKKMDPAARRAQVVGTINSKFDYLVMGQFILGREWRALSGEQKNAFVGRFSHILRNTYIGRIESYTDEKVRYVAEDRRDDKARVDTIIVGSAAQIPVNYKLFLKDGRWQIYDVTIEGVSLLINYQTTYSEIIRKEGFDGLLQRMDEKLDPEAGK